MTNQHIERAHQLFLLDRIDEAQSELKKALAQNPELPMAYVMLAECHLSKNEFQKAVDMSKQAIAKDAGESLYYYVLGKSSFYNKDIPGARLAINEGQRLDPGNAQFFLLRSQIEFYQQNWESALNEANRGLELDPENVNLVNQRAQALIKLNRKEDAAITMDYALHKAPESSYSHANKGWVAIERDEYENAIQSFLEALRLDPDNDLARQGLKEAIKGKNPVYRLILKYFLWMSKMQEKYQWGFIIGIYLLYRLVLGAARNFPALAPFLYPLIVLYVLFAFSTWIAAPVSNLFLRLHPIGKHALDEDENLGSNITGIALLVCILSFVTYFITDEGLWFRSGIVAGIMLIPIGGTFTIPKQMSARKGLGIYAIILGLAGIVWVLFPDMIIAVGILGLGIFAYGWVANYFISKSNKEFF